MQPETDPTLIEIRFPGEELEDGTATLSEWLVAAGDPVEKDQPLAELETEKVTLELAAPTSGTLSRLLVEPGTEIDRHTVLAHLSATQTPSVTKTNSSQLKSPAVRKLLREHQLDSSQIPGSGRAGRVTRRDVENFIAQNTSAESSTAQTTDTARPGGGEHTTASRRVPHSPMRRRIAEHMVESLLHTAPHVTSIWQMDMSQVMAHRKWHKKEFQEAGVNLTYTAYFLVAAAKALKAVPETNARFHEDSLELIEEVNIGVGTALEDAGLIVPVIPSVEKKPLFELAKELTQQTQRAREGKLQPTDMQGGTFTLSNHGVSGSLMAAPIIINQPQVAILGIGKLEKRVIVEEQESGDVMQIRPMCYVSLTIDHRALDAFHTNRWLSVFTQTIEHWGE